MSGLSKRNFACGIPRTESLHLGMLGNQCLNAWGLSYIGTVITTQQNIYHLTGCNRVIMHLFRSELRSWTAMLQSLLRCEGSNCTASAWPSRHADCYYRVYSTTTALQPQFRPWSSGFLSSELSPRDNLHETIHLGQCTWKYSAPAWMAWPWDLQVRLQVQYLQPRLRCSNLSILYFVDVPLGFGQQVAYKRNLQLYRALPLHVHHTAAAFLLLSVGNQR